MHMYLVRDWGYTGPPTNPIWMVDDIIKCLRNNTKILISDADKILSLQGIHIGETSRVWVERGDYVQAVLLLAAQTIDVMRQVRAPE